MPADLISLSNNIDSVMSDLRADLISSLNDESRFINNFDYLFFPSHGLTKPDAIDVSLQSIDDINVLLQNSLNSVSNYDIPELPDSLQEDIIRYDEAIFHHYNLTSIQDHLDAIVATIDTNSGLARNGSNIEAIQEAIYNYKVEYEREKIKHTITNNAYKWAADGYEEVPSAMTFETAWLLKEFDNSFSERSEDVFFKIANTIQGNIHACITSGLSIETMHMDFTNKFTALQKIAIDNELKAYTAEIEKIMDEIKAPVEQISAIVNAARIDSKKEFGETKVLLDKNLAEIQSYTSAYGAKINSDVNKVHASIQAVAALAESYGSLFTLYGSKFTGVALEEQSADSEV